MRATRRLLTVVVAGVFVLLLGYQVFGPSGYMAIRERERQKRALEDDIRRLTLENLRVARQVKALRTDPQAVERVAREEMKLARPGEVIYVLPDRKRGPGAGGQGSGNTR